MTIKQIAKGKGERAEQAMEIMRINAEIDQGMMDQHEEIDFYDGINRGDPSDEDEEV